MAAFTLCITSSCVASVLGVSVANLIPQQLSVARALSEQSSLFAVPSPLRKPLQQLWLSLPRPHLLLAVPSQHPTTQHRQ
jgi:hypothetical protein